MGVVHSLSWGAGDNKHTFKIFYYSTWSCRHYQMAWSSIKERQDPAEAEWPGTPPCWLQLFLPHSQLAQVKHLTSAPKDSLQHRHTGKGCESGLSLHPFGGLAVKSLPPAAWKQALRDLESIKSLWCGSWHPCNLLIQGFMLDIIKSLQDAFCSRSHQGS